MKIREHINVVNIIIFCFVVLAIFYCYDTYNWETDKVCENWQPVSKQNWVNAYNCLPDNCWGIGNNEKTKENGLSSYKRTEVKECYCSKYETNYYQYCSKYREIKIFRHGYKMDVSLSDEINELAGNRSLLETRQVMVKEGKLI